MKKMHKLFIWLAILLILALSYGQIESIGGAGARRIAFSEFLKAVDDARVESVVLRGREISGLYRDGARFYSTVIPSESMISKMNDNNVRFEVASTDSFLGTLFNILLSWLPILFFALIWFLFIRQMQSGGNKALGFGKSKAKLFMNTQGKVTFEDVAGIEEAKEELMEIVDFLKNPQKFINLGCKIPKGCLLVGSPGTGKTLLARSIAGEANVPFFSISGSDFVEMFVGVGASRVRDMFEQGKKHSPCIIFIDEIDAVGRHRGIGLGGGNDEREQTLNQLLVEMDGFIANEGVIIIAATNRPDVLDPALLRPGRFDRRINIPTPDIKGRADILNIHMKRLKKAPNIDVSILARATPGFSGAELFNLSNEAAILAARRGKKVVTMEDFEDAKDKVMMGAERRSMVMKEEEKRLTAYHESGHAIVAASMPASDPIHKATIMPRGRALGLVMRLPTDDRLSLTREKMLADLAVAMGGRVAEEKIFGSMKVTSGASSDIQQATQLARAMVMKWGMSDVVGPLFYDDESKDQYSSIHKNTAISDATSDLLSKEIKKLIDDAYNCASNILDKNMDILHKIAKALLEYETLTGADIDKIMAGKELDKKSDNSNVESVSAFSAYSATNNEASKDLSNSDKNDKKTDKMNNDDDKS
ncbi:ATP-dependent zinc metalloprotease FtsH [Candidatus Xenohaliotis californiensis]|uniref:ATP-dependent zinc metalloprotease FtsH n=1 Tax=Candidatus Xenohaliotis californiensis TaxID=84677 RepID=A0ABM9N791_9RICK|nr:ATP-dependent zinc metalloprotease FtsH [Candidatus Xenohaliotis californiensis]